MSGGNSSVNDARTAPVAAWQVISKMTPEERVAWRVQPVTDNPTAAERGLTQVPFPFGWFAVCYSDELAVGEVRPIRYFGRELAIWRGEDGEARIINGYCRHLGAHLGHGGKVHGNLIECPFHAWRYDGSGRVVDIPYSKAIPPQVKKNCDHWPVAEANGMVWVWYHPKGEAPLWEVENFSETVDPEWTPYDRYEWLVHCPLQFMAENSADTAHFKYVHGTANIPDATQIFDGFFRSGEVRARMGTPRGEVDGLITNGSFGPGVAWSRFSGIAETLLISVMTPIDSDKLLYRFAFTQPKSQAEGPQAGVARALIRDIVKQVDQDKVIWDRQRFIAEPPICQGDGPIPEFRRWFSQFYL